MKSKSIQNLMKQIADTLNAAQASYEVWWVIEGKFKEQYSEVLFDYRFRDFFFSTCSAHCNNMIMEINLLFEHRNQAWDFYELSKLLRHKKYNDLANQIECAISNHKNTIKKIKEYRNKRVAHYIPQIGDEFLLTKCGIRPSDIISLLRTFNKLLIKIYKEIESPDSYPIGRIGRVEEATLRLLRSLDTVSGR